MAFTRSSLRHLSLLGLAAVSVVASPSHPLLRRGLTLRDDASASYVGCFVATGDAMMDNELVSDDLTVAACAQNCAGYTYFGIEFSRECWCGNELPATSADESACAASDTGSAPEVCDDNEWIRVWAVPVATTTSSSSGSTSASSSESVTATVDQSSTSTSETGSSFISVPLTTAPLTTGTSNSSTSSSAIYSNTTISFETSTAAPLTTGVDSVSSSVPLPIYTNITSSVLSSVGPVGPPVTTGPSVPLSTGLGVTSLVDPTLTSAPFANSTTEMTTSTVFATTVRTITSCAHTVTNCPAESTVVVTETIPVYTTVCPVAEASGRLTTITEGGYTTVLPISTSTIYATVTEIQTTRVIPLSTVGGTVFYSTVTESATTKVAPVGASTVYATVTEQGTTRVTLVRPTPTDVVVVVVTVTATICPTETGAYSTVTVPGTTLITPVSTSTIFSSVTVGGTVKVTIVGSSVVYTTVTVGATTRVTDIAAPGSGSSTSAGVSPQVDPTYVGTGTGYPVAVPTPGVWANSTILTMTGTGYPAASGSVVTSPFSNVTSSAPETTASSAVSTLTSSNSTSSATTETSTFQFTTTSDIPTPHETYTVSDEPTPTPSSDVTSPTAQPTSTASEEATTASESATVTPEPIITVTVSVDPTTSLEPTVTAQPTTTPDEPTSTTPPETPSSTGPCESTTVLAATPSPCFAGIPTACASLIRTPSIPWPVVTIYASQCSSAYNTGAANTAISSCFTNIRSPSFNGASAYACVSAAPVYCQYETVCVGATATGSVASFPTNAVDDGGFESGAISSSWTMYGDMSSDSVLSAAVSADVAHEGSYSLKTVFTNTDGGSRGWTQSLSLEPGALYEVSWWYYSTTSTSNTVSRVQIVGGGLSVLKDASTLNAPADTWVQVTQQFTPTANFATLYFLVFGNKGDGANVFYVDDIAITQM